MEVLLMAWSADLDRPVKVQCDEDGNIKVDLSEIDLADLGDVSDAAPGDGQVLTWNATSEEWEPADITVPAHASSHENGGADEISVAGLSGELADNQPPKAHASNHKSGGSDAIKLDELATPDDNTTLNATNARHGLLLKLIDDTTKYLRSDGTWVAPPGGEDSRLAVAGNSADQGVLNSTTLVDATDVLIPVGANEDWLLIVYIGFKREAGGAQQPKYAFTVPAGGGLWGFSTWSHSALSTLTNFTNATACSGVATWDKRLLFIAHYYGGANAGNVQLQFAQNVAENKYHYIASLSYILAFQLA